MYSCSRNKAFFSLVSFYWIMAPDYVLLFTHVVENLVCPTPTPEKAL